MLSSNRKEWPAFGIASSPRGLQRTGDGSRRPGGLRRPFCLRGNQNEATATSGVSAGAVLAADYAHRESWHRDQSRAGRVSQDLPAAWRSPAPGMAKPRPPAQPWGVAHAHALPSGHLVSPSLKHRLTPTVWKGRGIADKLRHKGSGLGTLRGCWVP